MLERVVLVSSAFALSATFVVAQANPRGEAKVKLAGKTVAIDYGRPSLKGRDMIGRLEVGKPWRMGADADTTLKTDADLNFGNVTVPKGSYVLEATKVAANQWLLNVKSDKAKVADVPLVLSQAPASVETLTIELKGEKGAGEFQMSWGDMLLKAPFTAK